MLIPAAAAAIFGALQVRLAKSAVQIDNAIFRLHHLVTAAIFVVASVLAACSLAAHHAVCEEAGLPQAYVNSYCSAASLFTPYSLPAGKPRPRYGGDQREEKIAYYKWVPYVLLVQAAVFLVPYWLWRLYEDGRLQRLVDSLGDAGDARDRQRLLEYLLHRRHRCRSDAILFYTCEELNFVVALGNLMYLDSFAGHTFSLHGLRTVDLLNTNPVNRTDAMSAVFPHVVQCAVPATPPRRVLCVLPFSDTLEKLYVYLFYWLALVVALATLAVLYRAVVLTCPSVRALLLGGGADAGLRQRIVRQIVDTGRVGDFLSLYLLQKNVDPVMFHDVLRQLADRLEALEAQRDTNMCV